MRNGGRDNEQWWTEYILNFSTLDNCLFKGNRKKTKCVSFSDFICTFAMSYKN